jgi:ketosteroid isomerase-like protein
MITAIAAGLGIATRIAQAQSPVEKEILKLENDWSTGWQKKDAAFLQKLWADEYINTDQDGATYTKAQDLANVSSPGTSVTSFALADMRVHVYGETAVVTGVNTIKATQNGKDISGAYRFTDVFVKRDGRWQVVATQGSLVAKKK